MDAVYQDAFACDWLGFKAKVKEFLDLLPGASVEQAEGGYKAISISYLHMEGSDLELYQAKLLLDIANRKMIEEEAIQHG